MNFSLGVKVITYSLLLSGKKEPAKRILFIPPVLIHFYILFILKFHHIHVIFPTFFKVRHECISHSIYLLCLITNVVYAVFSSLSRQIILITSQILLFTLVYFVKTLTFKTFLILSLFLSSQKLVLHFNSTDYSVIKTSIRIIQKKPQLFS